MFAFASSLERCLVGLVPVLLVGCASTPSQSPEPAPATTTLQEYVQQASKAGAEGSREKARETYRVAAKAYPASQLPWLKLAEDYFEAADYGNAILAAQEVLQRDSGDSAAASLMAISGLRVSTSALQVLRTQRSIATGTRGEAESMARTLREVLGEPVLVTQPSSASDGSAGASTAKARPKPARPPAAVRAQAASSKAPGEANTGSSNPFDKLR